METKISLFKYNHNCSKLKICLEYYLLLILRLKFNSTLNAFKAGNGVRIFNCSTAYTKIKFSF